VKAKKPKQELILPPSKSTELYERMRGAVDTCHTIDDCKEIGNQAAGIAAYYAQIQDRESEIKFAQIKLRAWRRIGEILNAVEHSDCESVAAHIRKARQQLNFTMNDSACRQALQIADLPLEFFENQIAEGHTVYSIMNEYAAYQRAAFRATPEGKRQQREAERIAKADEAKAEAERRTYYEKLHAQAQAQAQAARSLQVLKIASDQAYEEVGITLERRDREQMKEIVFLIKSTTHETLRIAAFDHRMTMQAILRAGLAMWFIANGYPVPEEMGLQNRQDRPTTKNQRKES